MSHELIEAFGLLCAGLAPALVLERALGPLRRRCSRLAVAAGAPLAAGELAVPGRDEAGSRDRI